MDKAQSNKARQQQISNNSNQTPFQQQPKTQQSQYLESLAEMVKNLEPSPDQLKQLEQYFVYCQIQNKLMIPNPSNDHKSNQLNGEQPTQNIFQQGSTAHSARENQFNAQNPHQFTFGQQFEPPPNFRAFNSQNQVPKTIPEDTGNSPYHNTPISQNMPQPTSLIPNISSNQPAQNPQQTQLAQILKHFEHFLRCMNNSTTAGGQQAQNLNEQKDSQQIEQTILQTEESKKIVTNNLQINASQIGVNTDRKGSHQKQQVQGETSNGDLVNSIKQYIHRINQIKDQEFKKNNECNRQQLSEVNNIGQQVQEDGQLTHLYSHSNKSHQNITINQENLICESLKEKSPRADSQALRNQMMQSKFKGSQQGKNYSNSSVNALCKDPHLVKHIKKNQYIATLNDNDNKNNEQNTENEDYLSHSQDGEGTFNFGSETNCITRMMRQINHQKLSENSFNFIKKTALPIMPETSSKCQLQMPKQDKNHQIDILKEHLLQQGYHLGGQSQEPNYQNLQQQSRRNQKKVSKQKNQSIPVQNPSKVAKQDNMLQNIENWLITQQEQDKFQTNENQVSPQVMPNSEIVLNTAQLHDQVLNLIKNNIASSDQSQYSHLKKGLLQLNDQSLQNQPPTTTGINIQEVAQILIQNSQDKQPPKLPNFHTSLQMINKKMKKKPWHTYKRGRKRHGKYRKSLWCKKVPKNTYEPRIVPRFKFDVYGNQISHNLSNMKIQKIQKNGEPIINIQEQSEISLLEEFSSKNTKNSRLYGESQPMISEAPAASTKRNQRHEGVPDSGN